MFLVAQITISGEIRPRSEYRHGFKTLAQEDQQAAFFIDQRTRLNVLFSSNKTQYYVSLQDVRVWGNQPQLVVNQGVSTGVHQAWAKVILNPQWAMKLGRQEIAYDDQRIFGNVGWAQQARSHDAALLVFQDSTFTAQLGLAFNQDRPQLFSTRYNISNNYKSIQFLWLQNNWGAVKGSFLFLNDGRQVNFSDGGFKTNYSQTIGGRLSYQENQLTANLSLYYQGGTHADTLDTKVDAYYLGGDIAYSLNNKLTLAGGIEVLSGNDQSEKNGKNNAFNPLYGTNHKFNGLMDYFYVGNHIGSVGLNDLFVKAKYKKGDFNTGFAFHYFLTNGKVANPQNEAGVLNDFLGTEIDYTIGWRLNAGATMKMGYSQLFGSETMETLKGGSRQETNNWFWAMITIKPSFTFKNNK